VDYCYKLYGLPPHLKKLTTANQIHTKSYDESDDAISVTSHGEGSDGQVVLLTLEQHCDLMTHLQQ
jgi:hypothetical protein